VSGLTPISTRVVVDVFVAPVMAGIVYVVSKVRGTMMMGEKRSELVNRMPAKLFWITLIVLYLADAYINGPDLISYLLHR
jgi:hypothetical protein